MSQLDGMTKLDIATTKERFEQCDGVQWIIKNNTYDATDEIASLLMDVDYYKRLAEAAEKYILKIEWIHGLTYLKG